MNLSVKQKWNHKHRKQTCGCQGGIGGGGEIGWEFGISRCKLPYTECINHKVLFIAQATILNIL